MLVLCVGSGGVYSTVKEKWYRPESSGTIASGSSMGGAQAGTARLSNNSISASVVGHPSESTVAAIRNKEKNISVKHYLIIHSFAYTRAQHMTQLLNITLCDYLQ